MGLVTITFSGPANSPSRRLTSTVSIVVPSKTTKGWPCAEFTFTSGARLLPDVEASAGWEAAACGKLEERAAGAVSVVLALKDSASGREALSSAVTRLEAKRALKAIAFSASATGSRGGSVAWAGTDGG